MRVRALSAAVVLSAVCASCGTSREEGAESAPVPRLEVTLQVRNYNYLQARIFARSGGYRERLGTVESGAERSFAFSWPHGDLQVEVSLISVPSTLTEPMPVLPGDTLQLEIQQSPGTPPMVRRVRE